jgi:transposase
MIVAYLCKKMLKGRAYYFLRETVRDGKHVRTKWQKYLGSAETIMEKLEAAARENRPVRFRPTEYGSVFTACELEKTIDTIGIVDSIVPASAREKGPSVGEYFFYAWANRLFEPKSKNGLEEWYSRTAIESLRSVDLSELTSARYWEKWDRVSKEQVEAIASEFFKRVWALEKDAPDCMLFDTTNYYSYMSSATESELMARGKNKAGKSHLRQVGLALSTDRKSGLPVFCREYSGSEHDSKLFARIIDEFFGVLGALNKTKSRLTVVFDKGMNSEDNISFIDDHERIHFVTTYSTYFAEDLASTGLSKFSPLALKKYETTDDGDSDDDSDLEIDNADLDDSNDDRMLAYRTRQEFWGAERTVVVTSNPKTKRKKLYTLEQKLETIREALLEFRRNFREKRTQWRSFEVIKERYMRLCERLHLGAQYYSLELDESENDFSFRKDQYQIAKAEALAGKNIIVTDNHDWTTEEIVQASLDRSKIEQAFRASKSPRFVGVNPIFHWTDSKIRCHLLVCVIALTMKRLLEIRVKKIIPEASGDRILDAMRNLQSGLFWYPNKRAPITQVEEPNELQSVVLNSFGYTFKDGTVLQA